MSSLPTKRAAEDADDAPDAKRPAREPVAPEHDTDALVARRIVAHPDVSVKRLPRGLFSANISDQAFYDARFDDDSVRARGLFLRGPAGHADPDPAAGDDGDDGDDDDDDDDEGVPGPGQGGKDRARHQAQQRRLKAALAGGPAGDGAPVAAGPLVVAGRGYAKFFYENEARVPFMRTAALEARLRFPCRVFEKANGFLGVSFAVSRPVDAAGLASVAELEAADRALARAAGQAPLVADGADAQPPEEPFFLETTSKSTTVGPFAERFRELLHRALLRAGRSLAEYTRQLAALGCSAVFEVVDPQRDPHIIDYETDAYAAAGLSEGHVVLLDLIGNSLGEWAGLRPGFDATRRFGETFGLRVKAPLATLHTWPEYVAFSRRAAEDYGLRVALAPGAGLRPGCLDPGSDAAAARGLEAPIEGFVLEDAAGFMVKVKSRYYVAWKRARDLLQAGCGDGGGVARGQAALRRAPPLIQSFIRWYRASAGGALGEEARRPENVALAGARLARGFAEGEGPPLPRRVLSLVQLRRLFYQATGLSDESPLEAEAAHGQASRPVRLVLCTAPSVPFATAYAERGVEQLAAEGTPARSGLYVSARVADLVRDLVALSQAAGPGPEPGPAVLLAVVRPFDVATVVGKLLLSLGQAPLRPASNESLFLLHDLSVLCLEVADAQALHQAWPADVAARAPPGRMATFFPDYRAMLERGLDRLGGAAAAAAGAIPPSCLPRQRIAWLTCPEAVGPGEADVEVARQAVRHLCSTAGPTQVSTHFEDFVHAVAGDPLALLQHMSYLSGNGLLSGAQAAALARAAEDRSSRRAAAGRPLCIVMFCGIPGIGKSTLARCLEAALPEAVDRPDFRVVRLSQDLHAGDKRAFFRALREHAEGGTDVVIVDRNNQTPFHRLEPVLHMTAGLGRPWRAVLVRPGPALLLLPPGSEDSEPGPAAPLLALALARIGPRVDPENRSLDSLDGRQREDIVRRFFEEFVQPAGPGLDHRGPDGGRRPAGVLLREVRQANADALLFDHVLDVDYGAGSGGAALERTLGRLLADLARCVGPDVGLRPGAAPDGGLLRRAVGPVLPAAGPARGPDPGAGAFPAVARYMQRYYREQGPGRLARADLPVFVQILPDHRAMGLLSGLFARHRGALDPAGRLAVDKTDLHVTLAFLKGRVPEAGSRAFRVLQALEEWCAAGPGAPADRGQAWQPVRVDFTVVGLLTDRRTCCFVVRLPEPLQRCWRHSGPGPEPSSRAPHITMALAAGVDPAEAGLSAGRFVELLRAGDAEAIEAQGLHFIRAEELCPEADRPGWLRPGPGLALRGHLAPGPLPWRR
ncbi:hypothetical protein H696_05354 [Fonticula alba]|uniref:Uncharacterized protein n=1 Tax=Fonticula alba TaxID=691883 RepID=A0A058Z3K8_FONAL|nr:hypothetical protein H696_05354 [Fonticula alba]KCV68102.1 hypothetical protein H696_05354 [Fonticula alba]|eukprot:XP_009497476.1 hypothetical protein H696_05354 [Fonticula alba]